MLTLLPDAGHQFDYVFDWTILKYPQIGSGSRGRVCIYIFRFRLCFSQYILIYSCIFSFLQPSGKLIPNPGPSGADKTEKMPGIC